MDDRVKLVKRIPIGRDLPSRIPVRRSSACLTFRIKEKETIDSSSCLYDAPFLHDIRKEGSAC
jgi:hypothetical protein